MADRPKENSGTPLADGPLILEGNFVVKTADGTLLRSGTGLALCRCGASGEKPFCDGSHKDARFSDDGKLAAGGSGEPDSVSSDNEVVVTVMPSGPLVFQGPLEVRPASEGSARACEKGAFCRCGASASKPFCDGAHGKIGFSG